MFLFWVIAKEFEGEELCDVRLTLNSISNFNLALQMSEILCMRTLLKLSIRR